MIVVDNSWIGVEKEKKRGVEKLKSMFLFLLNLWNSFQQGIPLVLRSCEECYQRVFH